MNASELNRDTLTSGVYYLNGNDSYWLKYAENVFKSLLPLDSLSLYIFDKIFDINDALNALFTLSFDGSANVILVRDTDFKLDDKGRKRLSEALKNDISPNFIIFSNVNFLSASDKKKMQAINCNRLDKYSCSKYAQKFFTSGIDKKALDLLIEYTNCDMARISVESEKLLAFCQENAVKATDVSDLVVEDTELQIYEFVNNIVSNNKTMAKKQMDKLLKRGEAPSYLMAALVNQYRRMLHCSLSKLDNKALSEIFNVKEYAILKARENKYTKMKLKNTVDMLINYEYKFKSGEMSEQTAFNCVVSYLFVD